MNMRMMKVTTASQMMMVSAASNWTQQLVRVPVEQPGAGDGRVLAEPEVLDHLRVARHADQQAAEQSGDAVGVDHAERVVDLA